MVMGDRIEPDDPDEDPVAVTAGEQDHTDPWVYAAEETTPPGGDD